MIDALLALTAAIAAMVYLGFWAAGDAPGDLTLAIWSSAFSVYAYRVHRMKRRLSDHNIGELLKSLRETA
jgi:hypothetical protein